MSLVYAFLTPVYSPIIAVVTVALMWACGARRRTIIRALACLAAFWAVSAAITLAWLWYAFRTYEF